MLNGCLIRWRTYVLLEIGQFIIELLNSVLYTLMLLKRLTLLDVLHLPNVILKNGKSYIYHNSFNLVKQILFILKPLLGFGRVQTYGTVKSKTSDKHLLFYINISQNAIFARSYLKCWPAHID